MRGWRQLLLVGLGSAHLGSGAAAQGMPAFTRRIAPFPVADGGGKSIAQPFLGGFDVPRPQMVDIDADGDLDLFVQERSNAVMFFENVGGVFTWRSDAFQGLTVGEWYRFVDFDQDGRIDLLSESPISYIRAWRNVGTREAARFVVAQDTVRDNDGAPLPADRQNILNAVDIDCNGRLDLFLGRVAGTVDRFEAVPGTERNGVPRFVLHTERFENIEVLGPVPGQPGPSRIEQTGTRHGANTLAFGDIDGDRDIDLFWGDYFEKGLLLFENRSAGCGVPNMRDGYRRFPDSTSALTSGYNAPSTGDVDGDGLLDVVMGVIGGSYAPRTTAVNNLYLMSQVAPGRFEVSTRRLIHTVDVGNESAPTLADLDGDGDLDLLVGNKIAPESAETASLTWFENSGSARTPRLQERGLLPLRGEFHYVPAVVDLDADGLPDLVMGTWRDRVQWWRNAGTRGTPRFELADSALVILTRGSNTAPSLADLDGDGDLDMMVGEASGQLNMYRNAGSRFQPRFELVSDVFQSIDVGRRSAPHLVDFDGDGDADLLLGSEDGGVQLWRNHGASGELKFERVEGFAVASDLYSVPSMGDIDGDGDLDLVVGGQSGGLLWFERTGSSPAGDAVGRRPQQRAPRDGGAETVPSSLFDAYPSHHVHSRPVAPVPAHDDPQLGDRCWPGRRDCMRDRREIVRARRVHPNWLKSRQDEVEIRADARLRHPVPGARGAAEHRVPDGERRSGPHHGRHVEHRAVRAESRGLNHRERFATWIGQVRGGTGQWQQDEGSEAHRRESGDTLRLLERVWTPTDSSHVIVRPSASDP